MIIFFFIYFFLMSECLLSSNGSHLSAEEEGEGVVKCVNVRGVFCAFRRSFFFSLVTLSSPNSLRHSLMHIHGRANQIADLKDIVTLGVAQIVLQNSAFIYTPPPLLLL